jgi:hypothetical protein
MVEGGSSDVSRAERDAAQMLLVARRKNSCIIFRDWTAILSSKDQGCVSAPRGWLCVDGWGMTFCDAGTRGAKVSSTGARQDKTLALDRF